MRHVTLIRAPAGGLHDDVRHGFTTRAGGVGEGAVSSLSLARSAALSDGALVENWRRALAALDPRVALPDLALMEQVHGAEVAVVARGAGPLQVVARADGLVTTQPGVALAVRVADCVPVLLSAPGGVGAAHAGWRGVAAGVVGRTVAALADATGAPPSDVRAVIGPYVHLADYEVGPEVVEGIAAAGVPRSCFARVWRDRFQVDLGAAVRWQLGAAGVSVAHDVGRSTSAPDLFSWRHDGPETGRQAGVVVRWP